MSSATSFGTIVSQTLCIRIYVGKGGLSAEGQGARLAQLLLHLHTLLREKCDPALAPADSLNLLCKCNLCSSLQGT